MRSLGLENQPHALDVVRRPTPISGYFNISEFEGFLQSRGDSGRRTSDLAGDEVVTSQWRLVVVEDTGNGKNPIFSRLSHELERLCLGTGVGAVWGQVKRLILW